MSFTVELFEKLMHNKAIARDSYGIIEAGSPVKMVSQIAKIMPEDTKGIMLFISGRIDYVSLSNAMKECWDLPVVGGVVDAVGDTRVSYEGNRALCVFLSNNKMPMIKKASSLSVNSDSIIFTGMDLNKAREIKLETEFEVFGSNIYTLYYNGEKVPEDSVLVIPVLRAHLLTSTIHNGRPDDYRTDFMNLLDKGFSDWPSYFIITCASRVDRMGEDNLKKLEHEKNAKYSCKQGFGFGAMGVYCKDESGITRLMIKTLGLMKI